jgi:hypothetical protein
VAVGGSGVSVGGGRVGEDVAVGGTVSVAVGSSSPSVATGNAVAGSLDGSPVESGVLVGITIQETGPDSMLSKVGSGVRVGAAPGRRCSANCEKAVLKMI